MCSKHCLFLERRPMLIMGANPGGATGAIAPPRICHKWLNIA